MNPIPPRYARHTGFQTLYARRDISHPETEAQNRDVLKVLKDLNLEEAYEAHGIEVLNKCDLLENSKVRRIKAQALRALHPPQCVISALRGEGTSLLLDKIDHFSGYFFTLQGHFRAH